MLVKINLNSFNTGFKVNVDSNILPTYFSDLKPVFNELI